MSGVILGVWGRGDAVGISWIEPQEAAVHRAVPATARKPASSVSSAEVEVWPDV